MLHNSNCSTVHAGPRMSNNTSTQSTQGAVHDQLTNNLLGNGMQPFGAGAVAVMQLQHQQRGTPTSAPAYLHQAGAFTPFAPQHPQHHAPATANGQLTSVGSSTSDSAARHSPFSQQSSKLMLNTTSMLGVTPHPSYGAQGLPPMQLPGEQRERQRMGMPLNNLFPMPSAFPRDVAVPPLLATPAELSLLEPLSPSSGRSPTHTAGTAPTIADDEFVQQQAERLFFEYAHALHLNPSAAAVHSAPGAGVLDLSAGAHRTISSPAAWGDKGLMACSGQSGMQPPHSHHAHAMVPQHNFQQQQQQQQQQQHMQQGLGSGQALGSQHGPGSQQGLGSTSSVAAAAACMSMLPAVPTSSMPAQPSSAGAHHTRGGSVDGTSHRALTSPAISTSQHTGLSDVPPLPDLPALEHPVTKAMQGPNGAVVQQILSEIPEQLQPVVLAKVAVRGRGGRQPAADPRAVDPSMDPRKVRRILANRQSAARSKLKQRVMLETLRCSKEVMAAQQHDVQDELQRLAQLVQDLQARNQQLEERLQGVMEEQRLGQARAASHNGSAQANNWQAAAVAAAGARGPAGEPLSPVGATAVLRVGAGAGADCMLKGVLAAAEAARITAEEEGTWWSQGDDGMDFCDS